MQKRMNPHAHDLLTMTSVDTPRSAEHYDRFVCAEIPSEDKPELRKLVVKFMVHGPCGTLNRRAPCMKNGKCTKGFPKEFCAKTNDAEDSYPEYRRRDPKKGGETANKPSRRWGMLPIDNSWIVPYNPELLLFMRCHVNIEVVTSIGVINYFFKYVHKGEDMTAYQLVPADAPVDTTHDVANNSDERKHDDVPAAAPQQAASSSSSHVVAAIQPARAVSGDQKEPERAPHGPVDEVTQYRQARYISPVEGFFKILSFPLHAAEPAVDRLPVHIKDMQYVTFDANANKAKAAQALRQNEVTKLIGWFTLNEHETDAVWQQYTPKQRDMGPRALDLLYPDIPQCYIWDFKYDAALRTKVHRWRRRVNLQSWPTIGRMYSVNVKDTERYMLRRLLSYATGLKSFEQLYRFDGHTYDAEPCETYQGVCARMGLLKDDKEWTKCLQEAAELQNAGALRRLFCIIMMHCEPKEPHVLWEQFKHYMCYDILLRCRRETSDNRLTINEHMENEAMRMLDDIIRSCSNTSSLLSLSHGLLEFTDEWFGDSDYMHEVIAALNYDRAALLETGQAQLQSLNDEQRAVYDAVTTAVLKRSQHENVDVKPIFLQAPGGTGKTYVLTTIINMLRASGKIVLAVASSGLAALLLPDGRTAHSRFKIPIELDDQSFCYIKGLKDATLELLKNTA